MGYKIMGEKPNPKQLADYLEKKYGGIDKIPRLNMML